MTERRRPDPGAPDAGKLVGLLADDARRSAFAAVQLGATSLDDVAAATRLPVARAAKALASLAAGGVVIDRRPPDAAALLRFLVDEGLLDRAGGEYWRIGGTVAVEPRGRTPS